MENMDGYAFHPFVRYARYLNLTKQSVFDTVIPYDARLFYTVKGEGYIECGRETYRMSEGTVLFLDSGIPYRIMTPDSSVCYALLNFDLTKREKHQSTPLVPASVSTFRSSMLIVNPTFDGYNFSKVMYSPKSNNLQLDFEYIVSEYTRHFLYYEERIGFRCAEIMLSLLRGKSVSMNSYSDLKANDIIRYVHLNYSEPLTNTYLAEKFSFHPNYISSLIKNVTGMPLHKYVIHVRLSHALDLIHQGERNVSRIAEATGFADITHFSKYFKQEYGVSPKKYMC